MRNQGTADRVTVRERVCVCMEGKVDVGSIGSSSSRTAPDEEVMQLQGLKCDVLLSFSLSL